MYHVSTQGVDERMINVHYYYFVLHQLQPMKDIHNVSFTRSVNVGQVESPPPQIVVHLATTVRAGPHTGHCMGVQTAPTTQTMANMRALSARTVRKVSRPPLASRIIYTCL